MKKRQSVSRTVGQWIAPAAILVLAGPVQAQLKPSKHPAPLPAIPPADGPLRIRLTYPERGQAITASDSEFVFGSLGTGRASLTIDGQPVPVAPNGAFLAWIALPPAPLDTSAVVLHLAARTATDSAALDWPVHLPRHAAPPPPSGVALDTTSLLGGSRSLIGGEPVSVVVRASPGAAVWLILPGGRTVPLAPDTATGVARSPFARGPAPAAPAAVWVRYAGVFPAQPLGDTLPMVTAALGRDTARAVLPLRIALIDPVRPPVVVVGSAPGRAGAGHAVGMPGPGGPYEWLLADGTPAAVTGRIGDYVRIRLSNESVTWVTRDEILAQLPDGTPPPSARAGLVRLSAGPASVTARVALTGRVPFRVDETDDDKLVLTLYSATSNLDWVQYGSVDSTVRRVTWSQPLADVLTVTFELARAVFGYRYRWDGSDLVLEIRRPPVVDRRHPLRGRVIAVDPGHPPVGATGPTGLREADANLGVGLALQRILESEGARVVMTRTTDTALGLYERTNMAEAADADLLVSIHNNAFPDGVNPFENNGSSTYYFHPRASRLAYLIQRGLLSEMGLRDLGYGRGDLALARPTWMPAELSEGLFLMIPEQENALRTPAFQQAYARGVALGIQAYLAERFGSR